MQQLPCTPTWTLCWALSPSRSPSASGSSTTKVGWCQPSDMWRDTASESAWLMMPSLSFSFLVFFFSSCLPVRSLTSGWGWKRRPERRIRVTVWKEDSTYKDSRKKYNSIKVREKQFFYVQDRCLWCETVALLKTRTCKRGLRMHSSTGTYNYSIAFLIKAKL